MGAPVKLDRGTLEIGAREELFDTSISVSSGLNRPTLYAPSRDGQRFIASIAPEGAMFPVTIWMNWTAGIDR